MIEIQNNSQQDYSFRFGVPKFRVSGGRHSAFEVSGLEACGCRV